MLPVMTVELLSLQAATPLTEPVEVLLRTSVSLSILKIPAPDLPTT